MATSRKKPVAKEEVKLEDNEDIKINAKKGMKLEVKEEDAQVVEAPKYKIGSIVHISKDAEADLNGFKLFLPYKKYTYTVEAYNADTKVYALRRLNLSLRLPESLILAPGENSESPLMRRQF